MPRKVRLIKPDINVQTNETMQVESPVSPPLRHDADNVISSDNVVVDAVSVVADSVENVQTAVESVEKVVDKVSDILSDQGKMIELAKDAVSELGTVAEKPIESAVVDFLKDSVGDASVSVEIEKAKMNEQKRASFVKHVRDEMAELACMKSSNPSVLDVFREILTSVFELYLDYLKNPVGIDEHFFVDVVISAVDYAIDMHIRPYISDSHIYIVWDELRVVLKGLLTPALHTIIQTKGQKPIEAILAEATIDYVSDQKGIASCFSCFGRLISGK